MKTFAEFQLLNHKEAYRLLSIMNLFLQESENLNYKLLPIEIYEKLDEKCKFDYNLENLTKDLQYLCKNNNLKCQDENPFGIRTLEEYKHRKKYYSITSSGIAFTRSVKEYLSYAYKQKIVSKTIFQRIEEDLNKLKTINKIDIYEWWDIFLSDCTKLFQSYQDYLNQFNSEEFDNLSDKIDFLNYKNDFIISINQMISGLGDNARKISLSIQENYSKILKIVHEVSEEKKSLHINILSNKRKELYRNETITQWENIEKWFLFKDDEQPTYLSILDYTTTVIGKIMKRTNVLSSVEYNHKIDEALLSYINLFYNCITLEEASTLYTKIYGVQNILHIASDHQESNLCEDFNTGNILKYEYEKLGRTRRKTMEVGFVENEIIKEKLAFEILKKQKDRENHLLSFIKDNKLYLSNITDLISQEEIEILLKWISNGMSSYGQTDDGIRYRMLEGNEEICLKTESGDLYIKEYILDFGAEE